MLPTQITQWSKKCLISLMKSVFSKRASPDEQQNQTTMTTNINYNKFNFMSIFFLKKKLANKVKIASDENETKQNNLHSIKKDMGSLHKLAR